MKQRKLNLNRTLLFALLSLIMIGFQSCQEDPCSEITCLNSGVCASGSCECPEGFTGTRCETISGEICGNIVCLNGGQCIGGACDCPSGWTGADCSIQQADPCDELNCINGGICVDGICACPPGFSGEFCEIRNTDPACESIECQNGGVCIDGTCLCPPGFTGVNCQTVIFNCNNTPCQNGGICDMETGACACPPGYGGSDCSLITDECLANPIDCLNGGQCINGSCSCPIGWTGDFCEIEDLAGSLILGTYLGTVECQILPSGPITTHDQTITLSRNSGIVTFDFVGHLNFSSVGTEVPGGFTVTNGMGISGSISAVVLGELSIEIDSEIGGETERCIGVFNR